MVKIKNKALIINLIFFSIISIALASNNSYNDVTLDDMKGLSNEELCSLYEKRAGFDADFAGLLRSEGYSRNITCKSTNPFKQKNTKSQENTQSAETEQE